MLKKTGCISASALGLLAAALMTISQAAAQQQPDTPPAQPAAADTTPAPAASGDAAPAQAPAAPAAQTPPPAAEPAAPSAGPKSVTLRIATPGGAYLQSQERALFEPFTKRHGYQVKAEAADVTLDALKARATEWDVVDIDGGTAAQGCKDQLLEPLDASALDGAAATDDFLPGAIQPCAVASVAWSAVVIYDTGAKKTPAKLADFFDVKRLPGKRVLLKQPKYTLEMALLADGVAPASIYTTLTTPEGENRAFAKLTAIKDRIAWADKPSDVFQQVGQKDIGMGMAFSGRAFTAIVSERKPLAILWDRQIYSFDYWAIPRGAKNAAAAKEFIRFATSAGQLADQTRWLPYGPARRSAVKLAGRHAELDMEMKPYLPTHEPNMQNALAFDGAWWTANEARVTARFTAWLEGHDTPAAPPPPPAPEPAAPPAPAAASPEPAPAAPPPSSQ
jgi:putative spermidine/putrescine transport system substrate-binding protein